MPFAETVIVDRRKLTEYLLSETHPRGRHKARLFRSALGLTLSDADWLHGVLLDGAKRLDAQCIGTSAWGTQWRLDIPVTRHDRQGVIRTIWLVPAGDTASRFVTAWVL